MKLRFLSLSLIAFSLTLPAIAREAAPESADVPAVTEVKALFEYPVVPDNLKSLTERTDYLLLHFWEPMDLNKKGAVDQTALYHAFNVYASAMPYADRDVVQKSVDELLKKLKKNPVLLLQFTKAAEENLYGNRANYWIDEVYVKFLDAITACKKLDKSRKAVYEDQRRRLHNSMPGEPLKSFDYETLDGTKCQYKPTAAVNVIEFGTPDCDDCNNARILMEVDLKFSKLMENGTASMAFILDEEDSDGANRNRMRSFPENWTLGYAPDIADEIDLRSTPSFYVLDAEGKIVGKNLDAKQAINVALMQTLQK